MWCMSCFGWLAAFAGCLLGAACLLSCASCSLSLWASGHSLRLCTRSLVRFVAFDVAFVHQASGEWWVGLLGGWCNGILGGLHSLTRSLRSASIKSQGVMIRGQLITESSQVNHAECRVQSTWCLPASTASLPSLTSLSKSATPVLLLPFDPGLAVHSDACVSSWPALLTRCGLV